MYCVVKLGLDEAVEADRLEGDLSLGHTLHSHLSLTPLRPTRRPPAHSPPARPPSQICIFTTMGGVTFGYDIGIVGERPEPASLLADLSIGVQRSSPSSSPSHQPSLPHAPVRRRAHPCWRGGVLADSAVPVMPSREGGGLGSRPGRGDAETRRRGDGACLHCLPDPCCVTSLF